MLELILVAELMAGIMPGQMNKQINCLIDNTVYEASAEGPVGMQVVVEVVLNRVVSDKYPNTPCGVVYDDQQFSWVNDLPNVRIPTEDERLLAAQAVFSVIYEAVPRVLPETTLHYINPVKATDLSWYDEDHVVAVIGNHHYLDFTNKERAF